MKLIKLSADHYIIVDDSKVKIDDLYLDDTNTVRFAITETKSYWAHRKGYKKITHSTRPLEPYTYDEVGEEIYGHMYDNIQRLSLSEVNELLREVDVEKKAEISSELQEGTYTPQHKITYKHGYTDGYNQALEDNKDTKYTETDLRAVFMHGFLLGVDRGDYSLDMENRALSTYTQPPTQWDVEFVDGKLKLV